MSKADLSSVIDLSKYVDTRVRVRFQGGREVDGLLKGFDKLDNLVLDECVEFLRDPNDLTIVTEQTRKLGLVVCRGIQVSLIAPSDGIEEIANPFTVEEGGDE